MRCRAGDLAVVITAANKSNIGKIVTVLRPYDGTGGIVLGGGSGPQWLVKCSAPLLWGNPDDRDGLRYRRTIGPAYDQHLQPIRPEGEGKCRSKHQRRVRAHDAEMGVV